MSEPMTDTASRRSLAQKWSMFEGQGGEGGASTSPAVDPAMMSMSERRALFEKNKTAPKPLARFGDAVTPSMMARGQGRIMNEQPRQTQLFPPTPSASSSSSSGSPSKTKKVPTPKRAAHSPVRNQPSPKRHSPPGRSPKKMVLQDDNGWKQQQR